MFADVLRILEQYPLFYPQYISGYERVRMSTTTQTNTTEMERPLEHL